MQTYTIPFSANDIHELLNLDAEPCVSVSMAFAEPGVDYHQNQLRFTQLLDQLQSVLQSGGHSPELAQACMKPLQALLEDDDFWSNRSGSLAIYINERVSSIYELPGRIEDAVHIANCFQIRPLLPLLEADTECALLAVNLGGASLYALDHLAIRELELNGAPTSARDFLVEGERAGTQRHGGPGEGSGSGQFFGHGEEDRNRELATDRYLSELASAVDGVLANSNRHLLLAGESSVLGELRSKLKYPKVLEQVLDGNPRQKSAAQLHEESLPLLEPFLREVRDAILTDIRRRQATDGAAVADDLKEILTAAGDGAVDSLFVRADYRESGSYKAEARELELSEDGNDLANQAALLTLANGGRVYEADATELPHKGMLAGLRF
jgi:hypothetical protein